MSSSPTAFSRFSSASTREGPFSRECHRPAGSRPRDRRPLFRRRARHWILPETLRLQRRGLLSGRPRNDGLGGWPELSFRQSRLARIAGLGRLRLSIRHPRRALVLGRRDSRHAVFGPRDDAFLLHLENPLRARLSSASLW